MKFDLRAILKARTEALVAMPREEFIAHLKAQEFDEFTQLIRYASIDYWEKEKKGPDYCRDMSGFSLSTIQNHFKLKINIESKYDFPGTEFFVENPIKPTTVSEKSCLTPVAA